MEKQSSISTRIALGVTVVALFTVALFASLSLYNTQRLFSHYLSSQRHGQQLRLAQNLSGYYQQNRSWRGLEFTFPMGGMGRGRGWIGDHHLIIADEQDLIIYDSFGGKLGERLSSKIARLGTAIKVQGEQVGTVILSRPGQGVVLQIEEDFRSSVINLTLLAALGAVLLAGFVSQALARRITRPLTSLAQASERMATEQALTFGLPTEGTDEIGALARSFNTLLARLAESQKLRQNLLSDLAHELRTPVSIIQSQLESVTAGEKKLSQLEVASLYEEVLRLGRLLEDLRTLSVAEAGEIKLNPSFLPVAEIWESLKANFQPLAQMNNVSLELLIKGDGEMTVYADPDRLRQILYNLLGNAFSHTPQGGMIQIVAEEKHPWVQISISDTGPGIPPEELPFIFSRYWRGGNSQKTDGLGLGLAISKALAKASGGELIAQNGPLGGAQFILSLPSGKT